jgi:hypothetical protein
MDVGAFASAGLKHMMISLSNLPVGGGTIASELFSL